MKVLHHLCFLVLYSGGYVFLVFGTLADGHGTGLFAAPLVAWLLFVVAFLLIPYTGNHFSTAVIISCISIFYLATITIAVIEQTGEGNFARTVWLLNRNPLLFALTTVWYLAGQALFWILLIQRLRQTRPLL